MTIIDKKSYKVLNSGIFEKYQDLVNKKLIPKKTIPVTLRKFSDFEHNENPSQLSELEWLKIEFDEFNLMLKNHSEWLNNNNFGNKADLSFQSCRYKNLSDINLSKSCLTGVDFTFASLHNSNFSKCDLNASNFVFSSLIGVNLNGSSLIGAELHNSNLYGSNLINANLDNSNLILCDFRLSNLKNANLNKANLDGSCFNCSIFPKKYKDLIDLSVNNLSGITFV